MQKSATVAAMLALAALPADAAEHYGPYFAGKGGPTFAWGTGFSAPGGTLSEQEPSNVIGSFGMALGYGWRLGNLPVRTELEFMNRTEMTYDATPLFNAGGGSDGVLASRVQNVTGMLNMYVYWPIDGSKVTPFVSGGVGMARNRVKGDYTPKRAGATKTSIDETSDSLAWSVGAGLSVELNRWVANDIQLRYVDLGGADWGPGASDLSMDRLHALELSFALRFRF